MKPNKTVHSSAVHAIEVAPRICGLFSYAVELCHESVEVLYDRLDRWWGTGPPFAQAFYVYISALGAGASTEELPISLNHRYFIVNIIASQNSRLFGDVRL